MCGGTDAAIAVMGELGVPVHDLHWVVEQGRPGDDARTRRTHYTATGSDRLAEAVADCVLRQLTVRRYRPLPAGLGSQAARRTARPPARRDALVPEAYRRLKVGEFHVPADAPPGKSNGRRCSRTVLGRSATCHPGPPPRARIVSREIRPG